MLVEDTHNAFAATAEREIGAHPARRRQVQSASCILDVGPEATTPTSSARYGQALFAGPSALIIHAAAKAFRSRSPDAQLPIREHYEAVREGIEAFFLSHRLNAAQERIGAGFTQPHEEKSSMSSGLELTHIREIQILRDQEPLFVLRRAPHVAIRPTLKALGRDGVDVVPQR